MDCDFSSSSVKSSDSKSNDSAEVTDDSSDSKDSPSSAGTSTKSSNSNTSGNGTKSSNSSAGKEDCSALLEGNTGWSWDVPKECRFNPDIDYGSMTDERDGKVYRTVTIGDQVWMAENLNYADSVKTPSLKRRNWCYNNVAANCDVTGRLYTWAAAMDSVKTGCGYENCSPTLPAQGVCPPNWHLPTYAEWNVLFTAVGGQSTAGKVLKSQSGWYSNGNGTDAFGFSALPAGNRYADGQFNYGGRNVRFWCSTEYHTGDAYRMHLDYLNEKAANPGISYKGDGYSIRCVKDSD
ncbi:MAG: fibrobacter succinogenes major paralogous domain-containing protein [Fibrobacter sp.]|nr:fibrobacter succinogenes major paralogous domain-containing protein [Fibrobacter sp.]